MKEIKNQFPHKLQSVINNYNTKFLKDSSMSIPRFNELDISNQD